MTKITQLPIASTISDSGVFVIVDGGITKQLNWQTLRTGGLKGDTGVKGNTGTTGAVGPMGTIVTIQVGAVTSGTTASVTVSTSTTSVSTQVLDFVLPQGPTGDTGVANWSALPNDIIPATDVTYNLGNPSFRWKDLYLSGTTLFLGDTTFSTTATTVDALILEATYLTPSTSFSVIDSTGILVGYTFKDLPGTDPGVRFTITDVTDNVITFTPSATFTPNLETGDTVRFSGPSSLTIDGAPIDVPAYTLPAAAAGVLGGVKIGSGINVTGDGTVSVTPPTPYVLSTATGATLGGVKIGAGVNIVNGVISVTTGAFALQTATTTILGGVSIGEGINITQAGKISVSTASDTLVGGVKIGSGLDISDTGTVSVSASVSVATSLTGDRLADSIVLSSLTTLGTLTNLVVTGNTTLQQTLEVYNSLTNATGVVIHDCSAGAIFVHSTPIANWTANFTNIPTTKNRVISVAVLINQGALSYIPNVVQINGQLQTINWQSGVVPTGNANKKDLVNFTFISPATTATTAYTVLGSLASYG